MAIRQEDEIRVMMNEYEALEIDKKLKEVKSLVESEQDKYDEVDVVARVTNINTNSIYLIFSKKSMKQLRLDNWLLVQQDGTKIDNIYNSVVRNWGICSNNNSGLMNGGR